MKNKIIYALLIILTLSCSKDEEIIEKENELVSKYFAFTTETWGLFVNSASLNELHKQKLLDDAEEFLSLANSMLGEDADLLLLVDKNHFLPATYTPSDLVGLDSLDWPVVNRSGHSLRKSAVDALALMHRAALKDEVLLLISSTYRSYQRQEIVYSGWVRQLGQAQADCVSAKAGSSEHQLGTVVDFGAIDASFTGTKMQCWLSDNAYKYGFSLSYPEGYEQETGYDYESWHYRYLGIDAVKMQKKFFDGLQHQFLVFWHHSQKFLREYWLNS